MIAVRHDQEREPAVLAKPTERQAPVACEAVPAQVGNIEGFARH
jgi:hypothetical protein